MTARRKPNRVSRPVRVTQAGTSTTYPHADYAAMARNRDRYAGEHPEQEASEALSADPEWRCLRCGLGSECECWTTTAAVRDELGNPDQIAYSTDTGHSCTWERGHSR